MNATNTLNTLESQHSGKLTPEATERLATIALVADIVSGSSPAKKKKAKTDSPWVLPRLGDKVRNTRTGEESVVTFLTTGCNSAVPTAPPEYAVGVPAAGVWMLSEVEPV